MYIQHAMSCSNDGFVTIRHNDLRDLTTYLLTKLCTDVETKPKVLPVAKEGFENQTANTRNQASVDTRPSGFWVRGQKAFLEMRLFDHSLTPPFA